MSKGVEALELIFTLFILIVVVLVVIRMFITKMSLGGIEKPVENIRDAYNYDSAKSDCDNLCSKYESDCSDTQAAVKFCLQKVSIDIDGNRITGEKGHYNVVEQIPMCEDGVYCFHIKNNCMCGSYTLDAKTCLKVLCDYYTNVQDFNSTVAMKLIRNGINWGTCEQDIQKWNIKDYTPIDLDPPNEVWLGPDYWWVKAGYANAEC